MKAARRAGEESLDPGVAKYKSSLVDLGLLGVTTLSLKSGMCEKTGAELFGGLECCTKLWVNTAG